MNTEAVKTVKARPLKGVVVSDKMQKTIVVEVERVFMHPKFGKSIKRYKKYKVHDEDGSAKIGDVVLIGECAPISKTKHMKLQQIL